MPRFLERPLARGDLEEILHRAIAIDARTESPMATVEDAYRIAAELGLSSESVNRALAEQNADLPEISGYAAASIAASGNSNMFERHLEGWLRDHLLEQRSPTQPTWWDQRRGWWPDISRNVIPLSMHYATKGTDGHFRATLAVPLIWLRFAYGGVGLIAIAATIGFAVAGLMGVAFWTLGIASTAAAAYPMRVRRIALSLQNALEEAASAGTQGNDNRVRR